MDHRRATAHFLERQALTHPLIGAMRVVVKKGLNFIRTFFYDYWKVFFHSIRRASRKFTSPLGKKKTRVARVLSIIQV